MTDTQEEEIKWLFQHADFVIFCSIYLVAYILFVGGRHLVAWLGRWKYDHRKKEE